MSNDLSNPIRPEILATKLAAAHNYEVPKFRKQIELEPRLPELLWFIQSRSIQPGGIERFVDEIIDTYPECLGKAIFRDKDRVTFDQIVLALERIPYSLRSKMPRADEWNSSVRLSADALDAESDAVAYCRYCYTETQDGTAPDYYTDAIFESFIQTDFVAIFKDAMRSMLPGYLVRVCTEKDTEIQDQWYCESLLPTLIRFMDLHAVRTEQRIAMTEVARKVFDALDFAQSERSLVRIDGDSRFGKTECVKTWCQMNPGKARLVSTPCSASEFDLHKAIAEAIGIDFSFRTSARELKEKVEYVVRNADLMFVFDEAHFLFPTRFSTNTYPMRLNWVRTQIVDRKKAVVLVSTPQEFGGSLKRFVKVTGHNIQQFLGRTLMTVALPNELEMSDLMAVARLHFPDLDEDYLSLIVSKAMQSECYLMAVEAIAKRARFISRRDGHEGMTLDDLDLAISEVMPSITASVGATVRQSRQARPKAVADPVQECSDTRSLRTARETPVKQPLNRGSEPANLESISRISSPMTPCRSTGRELISSSEMTAA